LKSAYHLDVARLPEHLFANPVWHALQTEHAHFAIRSGNAARYPSDVTPFGAVTDPSAIPQLQELLAPGESVWVIGSNLQGDETLECLQMVLPEQIEPPPQTAEITSASAEEMLALTDIAFPGFFRIRTCEMGTYYGLRDNDGNLTAMAGERLVLPGYPEISGVCTHPSHRGKGHAETLIWHLVRNHRAKNQTSWLHVTAKNQNAIALYHRLGFQSIRTVTLHRITGQS
jgi:ribosomal protein S18 acetylase RimI-like enzyme